MTKPSSVIESSSLDDNLIPKELRKDFHGQAFSDEFIYITPKELHHQHKLADDEGRQKQQTELFGNKYV
jgi:hypothetical protein